MDEINTVKCLSCARYDVRYYMISFNILNNLTYCFQFTDEKMRFQFPRLHKQDATEPKTAISDSKSTGFPGYQAGSHESSDTSVLTSHK